MFIICLFKIWQTHYFKATLRSILFLPFSKQTLLDYFLRFDKGQYILVIFPLNCKAQAY